MVRAETRMQTSINCIPSFVEPKIRCLRTATVDCRLGLQILAITA